MEDVPQSAPKDRFFDEARTELRSIRDVLRFAESRFGAEGLFFRGDAQAARREAIALIAYGLNLPHEILEFHLDARLTKTERASVLDLILRRIDEHLPAAYLTHEAWVAGYRFYVDERVNIPHPFSAYLTPQSLADWVDTARIRRVLDLGTGSGCLAVLAALSLPDALVDAVDISPAALEVARRNVSDYGLLDQVRLMRSDVFENLSDEAYDLIVCNPPTFDSDVLTMLPEECLLQPRVAWMEAQMACGW